MRTLKKTKNISLTVDDEFMMYCELNKVENPEKLAKDTFNRGFSLLKYGETPSGIKIKEIVKEKIKKDPDVVKAVTETVIEIKKSDNKDIYAE